MRGNPESPFFCPRRAPLARRAEQCLESLGYVLRFDSTGRSVYAGWALEAQAASPSGTGKSKRAAPVSV